MKTKTLALLLSTALTLTILSGCGSKNESPVTEKQEDTTESSTPEIVNIEDEEEKEEDSSIVTRPTHYDILPEVANASIADGTVIQIADMVFYGGYRMSADDVRKVVENSQTGAYMEEKYFDDSLGHSYPYYEVYDEYGYDVIAIMEWKYVDPETSSLPVPEAGMYLSDIYPNDYFEENTGITDSFYFGGGYCLSGGAMGNVKSGGKTSDELVAELESLGCVKVDDIPNPQNITTDDKGYYEIVGENESNKKKLIRFQMLDNYWTGKTRFDGSTIVMPLSGEAYFDENGNPTRISSDISTYYEH